MMLIPLPHHHTPSLLLMQRRRELTNMGDNAAHALLELLHGHLFLLQPAEHLRAASLSSPLFSFSTAGLSFSPPLTQSTRQPLPACQTPLKQKSKQLILEEWILAEATVTRAALGLVVLIIHRVHPHVNDVQDDFERLLDTGAMSQILGNKPHKSYLPIGRQEAPCILDTKHGAMDLMDWSWIIKPWKSIQ